MIRSHVGMSMGGKKYVRGTKIQYVETNEKCQWEEKVVLSFVRKSQLVRYFCLRLRLNLQKLHEYKLHFIESCCERIQNHNISIINNQNMHNLVKMCRICQKLSYFGKAQFARYFQLGIQIMLKSDLSKYYGSLRLLSDKLEL